MMSLLFNRKIIDYLTNMQLLINIDFQIGGHSVSLINWPIFRKISSNVI
jgi:hypothetical protein